MHGSGRLRLAVRKRENVMITRRGMLQRGAAGASAVALQGGVVLDANPAAARTAVDFDVPAGACDCHVHVFGDPQKFPFAEKRIYTPPQASVEELNDLQRALKLDRVVIVQPSVYGTDNSCTVDGVRQLGQRGRGVAVIDKATPRAALEEMNAAGVRGVRLNLETNTARKFEPDAAGAGAGGGEPRPDLLGHRLAAPELRRRTRQAADRDIDAVPDRRRSVAQPADEVGARRGGPQENPGRQPGPALRLRRQGDLGPREQGFDLRPVRRP